MIRLMDLNSKTQTLKPVLSTEYFLGKTQTYHPEGLFSEQIFGSINTSERRTKFSYIEMHCRVLHPALMNVIKRLDRRILDCMEGEISLSIDQNGYLEETENGPIKGVTAILGVFSKIKFRGETTDRENLIKMVEHYRKKDLVWIDKCLVIPPAYRDLTINEDGEANVDPLNDYYLKILRLSSQIKPMQPGSSVYDVLSYKMYELVFELYQYISSKLSKKSGLVRGHLLGKRVDFSARAVISGASNDIKVDEIGVPFTLLVRLFEPFLMYNIFNMDQDKKQILAEELFKYNKGKLSATGLRSLFIGIYKHDVVPQTLEEMIKDVVKETIAGKIVLAKRDPSLHAESFQAFKPVMVDGYTIKLHPSKCAGFNADFDGDQMALYTPLTKQAIEECKSKMIVTASKDGMFQITDNFDKDVAIGIFMLTREPKTKAKGYKRIKSVSETNGLDIYTHVLYGGLKTTVGRIIFNDIFPKGFSFINEPVNKSKLGKICKSVFFAYEKDEYVKFVDQLLALAFKYGTLYGPSFSANDFELPESIVNLKAKLSQTKSKEEAGKLIKEIEKQLQEYLESKDGNLGKIGKAGGLKGGYGQTRQILVAKGLMTDTNGNVMDPVGSGYGEGLPCKSFFMSGAGSRSGIADRVLNTADTGYLSRQLVYALQRCEADASIRDCRTTRTFTVKVTEDIAPRLHGRYIVDKKGVVIPIKNPQDYIGQVIKLRSPLYCLSKKICKTCYGELLTRNKTQYVGVLAAQVFGERGTQLIMRTFHCLHKHHMLYVKKQDGTFAVISMEDLWNKIDSPVVDDGRLQQKEVVGLEVWDADKFTKINHIKRHFQDPGTRLIRIGCAEGGFITCQDNHPVIVYNSRLALQKDEPAVIPAKKVVQDIHFMKMSFPIWQNGEKELTDEEVDHIVDTREIPEDFIYYSRDTLKKIFCGIVDSLAVIFQTRPGKEVDFLRLRFYDFRFALFFYLIAKKIGCLYVPLNFRRRKSVTINLYIHRKTPRDILDYSRRFTAETVGIRCKLRTTKYLRHVNKVSYIKHAYTEEHPTEYLYDLTTDTSTFSTNCIWTHNSGGSVSIKTVDIISAMSNQWEDRVIELFKKFFSQKENSLVSSFSGTIVINKTEYMNPEKDIKRDSNTINLAYGYFVLETPKGKINVTLDFATVISLAGKDISEIGDIIRIPYKENEEIFKCPPYADVFKEKIKDINQLFSGKKPWRSADHFCLKIYDNYAAEAKDLDLVHFEVLSTHLLRDKNNPSYPARLNKNYSARVVSLKNIPALESWLSALSFENFSKSVATGLVYERDQDDSILEKIVNGDL